MNNKDRKQNVQIAQVDVINIFNAGGGEFSIKAILEPLDRYSEAGGTISVWTEDCSGSHFFSHAGNGSFRDFISQCDSHYLIGKLFKCEPYIPVTSTSEIIDWVAKSGRLSYIKDARHSNEISKRELRECYTALKEGDEYFKYERLCSELEDTSELRTLLKIFGDDLLWDIRPSKENPNFKRITVLMKALLQHLKDVN